MNRRKLLGRFVTSKKPKTGQSSVLVHLDSSHANTYNRGCSPSDPD